MKTYILYIVSLIAIVSIAACQRDDNEPTRIRKPISRLYVSTSDYEANSTTGKRNVFVIAPADSNTFTLGGQSGFLSAAKGGSTIHYSPFARSIFQSSMNNPAYIDTAIHMMSVSDKGVIAHVRSVGNRRFNNIKGLWYYVYNRPGGAVGVSDNYLLMTNVADTVNLFVIDQPLNKGNFAKPKYELMLEYTPWAIQMDSADLLLSRTGPDGGVVVYKNLAANFGRDTILTIKPSYELTIAGANNVRGLSYSRADDVLVLTDYIITGTTIAVGTGRILIFENFSKNSSTATIVPTRIITGANSKLQQPIDVAIDSRKDGRYIYVADAGPQTKKIFRFKMADEGDVAPDQSTDVIGNTPQSISLDARGANRDN